MTSSGPKAVAPCSVQVLNAFLVQVPELNVTAHITLKLAECVAEVKTLKTLSTDDLQAHSVCPALILFERKYIKVMSLFVFCIQNCIS
jgi:hypothetical protein